MRPVPLRRMRGFTAIEMMVVVVIVGILTAIAAPNMAAMIRNQRVKTAAFDLYASLTYARGEAVKRNLPITITPNDASAWSKGWKITDSNGTLLKEESDRKLTTNELTFTGPASVVFTRSGRLTGVAPQFSLTAANVAADRNRCVTVDLSGRPATKEYAC